MYWGIDLEKLSKDEREIVTQAWANTLSLAKILARIAAETHYNAGNHLDISDVKDEDITHLMQAALKAVIKS